MKALSLSLLLFTAYATFAQTRFGVKGGINLANQKVRIDFMDLRADQSGSSILSFHAGGLAEMPVSSRIRLRPELILTGKGADFKSENELGTETGKIRPYYLELSVPVTVFTNPINDVEFFAGLGPAVSYGLFGKAKSAGQEDDVFQEEGFKRFDFGINYMIGTQLPSGVSINLSFIQGLANIINNTDPEGTIKFKNRVFSLSVGYLLSR